MIQLIQLEQSAFYLDAFPVHKPECAPHVQYGTISGTTKQMENLNNKK